jgi:tight adherence protein B
VSGAVLVLGAVACFGALFLVAVSLLSPRPTPNRLAAQRARNRRASLATGVSDFKRRASTAAESALERRGRKLSLEILLEQADIKLRSGEALLLAGGAALAALLVGTLFRGLLSGLVLAAVVMAGGWMAISVRRDRRRTRFTEQLPDTLQLLAGSLRAGYGIRQALEMAATETEAPTCDELSRVMTEARLGRDIGEALESSADRMASDDFRWAIQAMGINREVGGDLAEVLEAVATTVRTRATLTRHVKALSAEGRLSAIVLLSLPPGVAAVILFTSPQYFETVDSGARLALMLGSCAALMGAGALWLRRLVRPVY